MSSSARRCRHADQAKRRQGPGRAASDERCVDRRARFFASIRIASWIAALCLTAPSSVNNGTAATTLSSGTGSGERAAQARDGDRIGRRKNRSPAKDQIAARSCRPPQTAGSIASLRSEADCSTSILLLEPGVEDGLARGDPQGVRQRHLRRPRADRVGGQIVRGPGEGLEERRRRIAGDPLHLDEMRIAEARFRRGRIERHGLRRRFVPSLDGISLLKSVSSALASGSPTWPTNESTGISSRATSSSVRMSL